MLRRYERPVDRFPMPNGDESALEQLFELELLKGIDDECRAAVRKQVEIRRLSPSETLFEVGEVSDALFVVLAGELELQLPSEHSDECFHMGLRSVGQTLGDFAFINRSRYLVRAVAYGEAVVARLSAAAFELIGDSDQDARVQIYVTAADLVRRVILAHMFNRLFDTLSVEQMQQLLEASTLGYCRGGDVLFEPGSPSDGVHFVVSGRFVTEQMDEDGVARQISEFRGPSIVGEIGALADSPRLVRLVAVRASVHAHLPRDAFRSIVLGDAALVTSLARHTLHSFEKRVTVQEPVQVRGQSRTVAFLSLQDDFPTHALADGLRGVIGNTTSLKFLDAARFDADFGVDAAASTGFDGLLDHSIARWLDEMERQHELLIYAGESTRTPWTERIVNRADRIVWLARSDTDPARARQALELLQQIFDDQRHVPRPELVLLHPPGHVQPTGTSRWLDLTGVSRVHHVREGDDEHIAALARRLTGGERGLVLSSGGARGYAHLGTHRFFEERGISIDHVGGTSMGALLGAAIAMGHDHEHVSVLSEQFARRSALFDYTLPLVSVLRSRRLTDFCKHVCGEIHIEDLWTPFFAVSSNLGDGCVVVHDRGPLWKAVRSSISLPGLFSPVPNDDGRLLVDGAVLNGFPVDIMRERLGGLGTLVGIDVSRVPEPLHRFTFGTELSGWRVLFSWISPLHHRIAAPRLIATLLRSTDIKDVERKQQQRDAVDILVEPDVSEWDLLDFKDFRDISDVGYAATERVLDAVPDLLAELPARQV